MTSCLPAGQGCRWAPLTLNARGSGASGFIGHSDARKEDMKSCNHTKGLDLADFWKCGQRVPKTGLWKDQYGHVTHYVAGTTFAPIPKRPGCAHRRFVGI